MTDIQKQCLLKYLGYYTMAVDGIFGSGSQQATRDFQADYGLEASGVFDGATEEMILRALTGSAEKAGDFWEEVRYFKKEEFRCRCGGRYCDGFPVMPERKLVRLADRVREHFGVPMTVSSGVRCAVHNANVGGVSGSRHKYGTAMDFCVRGISAVVLLEYILKQPETNYAYAIDGNFVHMDVVV